MDTIKSNTESRGGRRVELTVESFTTPGTHYTVRLYEGGSTCTCKAATHGRGCTKHIETAKAINYCRERASKMVGSWAPSQGEREKTEQRLLSLAKRLYSKPRKGETAAQSMDLVYEVDRERFATPQLRRDSWRRHGVVISRVFGDEPGAA